jgi:hypothetical protein
MVAQMRLTGGRLNSERSNGQKVVSAMHTTLGRGFFVLLNGHVNTPKKSVRLAFKPGQSVERINPLASIRRTRQTTFFVPRRDWKCQENFILHQLGHIQFARHRQEIPGVVLQLVLRHIGTFRNHFQQTVDIKFKRNDFQTTLTSQRKKPRHLQLQKKLSSPTLETLNLKTYIPRHINQQIMQAFQTRDSEGSIQNPPFPGKHESIRYSFQS